MRRSKLTTLLGGVLLAAFIAPSAAFAGAAPAPAAAATAPAAVTIPAITVGCALTVPAPFDAHPAIVCRWTAPTDVTPAVYRVWRSVDGGAAVRIRSIAADQVLRIADRTVVPGHLYSYRVVAVNASGARVAASALVSVRYARAPQVLTLTCAYGTSDAGTGVACSWNASTRTGVTRYALFRSVDGAARTVAYRAPVDGKRSFLDTAVSEGQGLRYGVVAFAKDGRILAVGITGPIVVPAPVAPAAAVTAQ